MGSPLHSRRNSFDDVRLDMDNPTSTKSTIVMEMTSLTEAHQIINGWDTDANKTIQNWFNCFKEYRWIYQYILDRNYKISTNLILLSVIGSSTLSVFSGFKMWISLTDFQNASNIIMLVSNIVIAGVTTMSKRYIDDSRNEKIRLFVEQCDKFIGIIYAQVSLAPIYRIPANIFFRDYCESYTNLMTSVPNLSIDEMELSKKNYLLYLKFSR